MNGPFSALVRQMSQGLFNPLVACGLSGGSKVKNTATVKKVGDLLQERLAWYKLVNGLTLEQLGVEMDRDPEQLSDWLNGRHKPCRRNREEVERFLDQQLLHP